MEPKNKSTLLPTGEKGEIVLYQPNESIRLEVRIEDETVWLTRLQMAELFGRDVKTIGKHVNNALKEELSSELLKFYGKKIKPVVAKFATTAISDNSSHRALLICFPIVLTSLPNRRDI